jgi:hypothetical protein
MIPMIRSGQRVPSPAWNTILMPHEGKAGAEKHLRRVFGILSEAKHHPRFHSQTLV